MDSVKSTLTSVELPERASCSRTAVNSSRSIMIIVRDGFLDQQVLIKQVQRVNKQLRGGEIVYSSNCWVFMMEGSHGIYKVQADQLELTIRWQQALKTAAGQSKVLGFQVKMQLERYHTTAWCLPVCRQSFPDLWAKGYWIQAKCDLNILSSFPSTSNRVAKMHGPVPPKLMLQANSTYWGWLRSKMMLMSWRRVHWLSGTRLKFQPISTTRSTISKVLPCLKDSLKSIVMVVSASVRASCSRHNPRTTLISIILKCNYEFEEYVLNLTDRIKFSQANKEINKEIEERNGDP